jgi:hypothetical protein
VEPRQKGRAGASSWWHPPRSFDRPRGRDFGRHHGASLGQIELDGDATPLRLVAVKLVTVIRQLDRAALRRAAFSRSEETEAAESGCRARGKRRIP